MKEPKCKICGGGHYKSFCYNAPRKAIKSSPIKRSKPLYAYTKPKSMSELYKKQTALKTPVSERKFLVKKLDTVFSKYIRKRDEYPRGRFRCCSCNNIKDINQADAGHFIPRGKMALRWDERNVNAECQECNRRDDNHLKGYKLFLQSKYGDDIINIFYETVRKSKKYTIVELKEMINTYRTKIENY